MEERIDNETVQQIDLISMLKDIGREWLTILLLAIAAALFADIWICATYQPEYRTSTTFVVTAKGMNNNILYMVESFFQESRELEKQPRQSSGCIWKMHGRLTETVRSFIKIIKSGLAVGHRMQVLLSAISMNVFRLKLLFYWNRVTGQNCSN